MEERRKRPRGRPLAKKKSERVKLRIYTTALDAYCIQSTLIDVPVRTLMRRVLEQHAPVICRAAKIPEHP